MKPETRIYTNQENSYPEIASKLQAEFIYEINNNWEICLKNRVTFAKWLTPITGPFLFCLAHKNYEKTTKVGKQDNKAHVIVKLLHSQNKTMQEFDFGPGCSTILRQGNHGYRNCDQGFQDVQE